MGVIGTTFPSPCGDVVLKITNGTGFHRRRSLVSVPLRGCGFEISISDDELGYVE